MLNGFKITSVDELKAVVLAIKEKLSGRDVLLLSGPMGVGKTELVRALINDLKVQGDHDEPTSPSFAIHNSYEVGGRNIDHLDLFRIESEDDLESTGFWDLFDQKNGLIILEWAEKLSRELLPPNWKQISVELQFEADGSRRIKID